MKYDKDVSIIIPYKPDGGYRDLNFSWLKKRYARLMPEAELCVDISDSEPFSRSNSVNNAVKLATRDIFIITDADILFDPADIENAVEMLSQDVWVAPFTDRIEIGEKDTADLLNKCPCENIKSLEFSDYKVTQPGVGSICIVPRKYFDMVKGFDGRFRGWGGEDCAFEMSLTTLCGPRFQPPGSKIWHLYHPQSLSSTYQSPYYPANYALYERYLGANGNADLMKRLIEEKNLEV